MSDSLKALCVIVAALAVCAVPFVAYSMIPYQVGMDLLDVLAMPVAIFLSACAVSVAIICRDAPHLPNMSESRIDALEKAYREVSAYLEHGRNRPHRPSDVRE